VIARELEKAGVPVVQLTALTPIPNTLGVNRVMASAAITYPTGDPSASLENEKKIRKAYVKKALEVLQKPVDKPEVFY
jgi:glycine reductase complex component B subunit gamma